MKNKLFLISILSILGGLFAFTSEKNETFDCEVKPFEVYLDDEDTFSNIRQTPNGKIVLKLSNEDSYGYILNVVGFENEWLKINEIRGIDSYTVSNFEGWVHASIVRIATTHSIDLLDKPNGQKVMKIAGETGETFKIQDVSCDWVRIKTEKGVGWVKSEKLCGNPVTTCP